MTNSKNHAFLICPANQTGAVGGTPPTRGAAGGQIKKETWEHAFEAALRGLPKAVSGDQALVHCLAFAQQVNAPAQNGGGKDARKGHLAASALRNFANAETNEDREQFNGLVDQADPKKGSHRSGPLLLCGAALFLFEPRRPQNLELPNAWLRDVVAPLRYRARGDFKQFGECRSAASQIDCVVSLHVRYLSTLKP